MGHPGLGGHHLHSNGFTMVMGTPWTLPWGTLGLGDTPCTAMGSPWSWGHPGPCHGCTLGMGTPHGCPPPAFVLSKSPQCHPPPTHQADSTHGFPPPPPTMAFLRQDPPGTLGSLPAPTGDCHHRCHLLPSFGVQRESRWVLGGPLQGPSPGWGCIRHPPVTRFLEALSAGPPAGDSSVTPQGRCTATSSPAKLGWGPAAGKVGSTPGCWRGRGEPGSP